MEKIKKYIIPIIPVVVLTFIVSKVFNPILDTFYSLFLQFGSFFIKSFSDSTYKTISNGYSEEPSLIILYFMFILYVILICIAILWTRDIYKQVKKKISALKKETGDLILRVTDSEKQDDTSNPEINKEDILSKLHDEQMRLEFEESNFDESHKKYFIRIVILSAILTIFMCSWYAQQVFINNAITKALSNIEIVSPYITDNEYRQLRSDFYSISNQEDYYSLLNTLKEIADVNSIVLKK